MLGARVMDDVSRDARGIEQNSLSIRSHVAMGESLDMVSTSTVLMNQYNLCFSCVCIHETWLLPSLR